jgi:hypothetical protein
MRHNHLVDPIFPWLFAVDAGRVLPEISNYCPYSDNRRFFILDVKSLAWWVGYSSFKTKTEIGAQLLLAA